MPQTPDLFPQLSPPTNPYYKTGAIAVAAALLCENIPLLHIEGTPTAALFVFDDSEGNAERVAKEYARGELLVIASVFVRNTNKMRGMLSAFQRNPTRKQA